MGHIGDADPDHMAAFVLRVLVWMRPDRIVAVTRVPGIDGDDRQMAQVLAVTQGRGLHRLGLVQHRLRKGIGDAMLVDRDQRHRLWRAGVAQPRHDARLRQAHPAARAELLCLDQFAVLRALRGIRRDAPFPVGALVDGQQPPALGALAEDAQDAAGCGADAADQPAVIVVARPPRLGHARRIRSPAPSAGSPSRAIIRMRGSAPSPRHSSGRANRSPASSGPVTCSTDTGGSFSASR
jgi:hypothetical protein